MGIGRTCFGAWAFLALFAIAFPSNAHAEDGQGSPLLQSILNDTNKTTTSDKKEVPKMPEPSGPVLPRERLSLGVNYTGAQIRWNLSPRWAMEGRYQGGTASSNAGDVTASVFGVRGYRFSHPERRIPLYLGSEIAYAKAEPVSSNYKVRGVAAGLFAGMEYRVAKRIAFDIDLGPYVLSLTETHTHTSSTSLDFIVNTALLVRIF